MQLDGQTKLVGVMGWPVEHTLSPPMQNAAIARLGLNWVYVPLAVEPAGLAEAVAGARALGFVGVNVTIPHKQAVLPLLDEIDDAARVIGAVNTVAFTADGRAMGYNTDAAGFTRTVEEEGRFSFPGCTMLLVGTGGAGRALATGAAGAGAARLLLHDVNSEGARRLAEDLRAHRVDLVVEVIDADGLGHAAAEADLLANATPLGMKPGDPLPVPEGAVAKRHTVFDAVYTPARTALLKLAAERGARGVPGLGMLARQGARSLAIWSGREPDEILMIEVLRGRLGLD